MRKISIGEHDNEESQEVGDEQLVDYEKGSHMDIETKHVDSANGESFARKLGLNF